METPGTHSTTSSGLTKYFQTILGSLLTSNSLTKLTFIPFFLIQKDSCTTVLFSEIIFNFYYFLCACMASQTFAGVMGMSKCSIPSGDNASIIAFAIAGGAPTVGDSATPLAPRGW